MSDTVQLHLLTCLTLYNCTYSPVPHCTTVPTHLLDIVQPHLLTCWALYNCTTRLLHTVQLHLFTCWTLCNCTFSPVGHCTITPIHLLDTVQLYLLTCWRLCNCTYSPVGHVHKTSGAGWHLILTTCQSTPVTGCKPQVGVSDMNDM